jgi:hypothetical protein
MIGKNLLDLDKCSIKKNSLIKKNSK